MGVSRSRVWYFALLPRGWISKKKSYDLQIYTRPTCRGILRDGIIFFFFEPEVFFSNLKSPKFTPTLLLCVLAVNGRPGCDPFMSRYVCHRSNVRHAHFLCLSGSLRSVFCQFYYCNFLKRHSIIGHVSQWSVKVLKHHSIIGHASPWSMIFFKHSPCF